MRVGLTVRVFGKSQYAGGVELADADGLFELPLAAGRYTLTPQPMEGLLGTPAPVMVEIAAGTVTVLSVVYDTGIR